MEPASGLARRRSTTSTTRAMPTAPCATWKSTGRIKIHSSAKRFSAASGSERHSHSETSRGAESQKEAEDEKQTRINLCIASPNDSGGWRLGPATLIRRNHIRAEQCREGRDQPTGQGA